MLPFQLLAGMWAADAAILKEIYWSESKALIISNGEMENIMKIVKSRDESGLLIKGVSETSKNEAKWTKKRLPSNAIRTLAASILGSA